MSAPAARALLSAIAVIIARLAAPFLPDLRTDFGRKVLAAITTLPTGSSVGLATSGNVDFSGSNLTFNPNTRQVSFSGASMTLAAVAADTFNQYFPNESGNPSNDFTAGQPFGTLSLSGATLR